VFEEIAANGIRFCAMKRGCQSRWWSIGVAARILFDTFFLRRNMAQNFLKMQPCPNPKAAEIAKTFLSLSNQPALYCDLALVRAYFLSYFSKHMKFFQACDPLTKRAGFGSFNVFVRTFLMREDYKRMKSFVGPNPPVDIDPHFEDLIEAYNAVPAEHQETQKKKMIEFFNVAEEENKKMFDPNWVRGKVSFLAAFSEQETAAMVCEHLLNLPVSVETEFFESIVHNRVINMREFKAYIEENIGEEQRENTYVKQNKTLFTKIASRTFNLWDQEDLATKVDRRATLRRFGIIFSQIQATERANKTQNNAASNRRKESNISSRVAAMGNLSDMTR
jgi:hypothetical protein